MLFMGTLGPSKHSTIITYTSGLLDSGGSSVKYNHLCVGSSRGRLHSTASVLLKFYKPGQAANYMRRVDLSPSSNDAPNLINDSS